ncbi:pyridoxal phosphate-dependent transferase [Lophiotrema nucula]|uniref:Pyridoxal phosphate-dependent transferase n=1 Tax=Lophiotrema nucula TaxID=690887 RepID=A0A6A5Z9V1_9PLEO|nr:pyridoxal phosphate-dependent transferase [Lophiotrema nucula]
MAESTLSTRGAELAQGPNMRDLAGAILGTPWDPTKNPDVIVNIGTAENHPMLGDVADFVKSKDLEIDGPTMDYGEGPWGSTRLRNGMARFMNRHFKPHTPIEPDELNSVNGCTSLFSMLGTTLADPGDGVLLTMPSYVAFATDVSLISRVKPVFVPFGDTDQFSPDCIRHYESARRKAENEGIRVRMLMLCHPHNPLGKCYPGDTLVALMKFCNKHKIHLIADEIYAMCVYEIPEPDAVPFTSVLSFDYSQYIDSNYLHHVYGMSKDFACGGLRIGTLWTKNKDLSRAISAISQFHYTGQLDDRVACLILEDEIWLDNFLKTSRERLATSNKLAKQLLNEASIKYASGSNAGLFLWINLRPWLKGEGSDDEWVREEKLMKKLLGNNVFITPGKGQASETAGHFRLVFSREEACLREGIKRIVKTLEEH